MLLSDDAHFITQRKPEKARHAWQVSESIFERATLKSDNAVSWRCVAYAHNISFLAGLRLDRWRAEMASKPSRRKLWEKASCGTACCHTRCLSRWDPKVWEVEVEYRCINSRSKRLHCEKGGVNNVARQFLISLFAPRSWTRGKGCLKRSLMCWVLPRQENFLTRRRGCRCRWNWSLRPGPRSRTQSWICCTIAGGVHLRGWSGSTSWFAQICW